MNELELIKRLCNTISDNNITNFFMNEISWHDSKCYENLLMGNLKRDPNICITVSESKHKFDKNSNNSIYLIVDSIGNGFFVDDSIDEFCTYEDLPKIIDKYRK